MLRAATADTLCYGTVVSVHDNRHALTLGYEEK